MKPGCFRGLNFYGRIGGDLIIVSTTSITGVWSNIIPAGTFIVLNMTDGADETAITGGVINMYKGASLTATDNNFILSDSLGIVYTGGEYVSGNVIDYMAYEDMEKKLMRKRITLSPKNLRRIRKHLKGVSHEYKPR